MKNPKTLKVEGKTFKRQGKDKPRKKDWGSEMINATEETKTFY
jgi:hypothetical protein